MSSYSEIRAWMWGGKSKITNVSQKRAGCICGLYTFLLMRILTKRPTAILRPFLESLKFFFARRLTKRPTAILRPFLESTNFCLLV